MPAISTCPRCLQMVSIPQGLDPATLVRCPLCGAEYLLDAAMNLAPPELIPADAPDYANLSDADRPANHSDQDEADIIRLESAAPKSIPIQEAIKSPPIKPRSTADAPKSAAGLITEPFFAADAKPSIESDTGILPVERSSRILPVESGTGILPVESGTGILPVESGTHILPVESQQPDISAPPIVSSFLLQYGAGEADEGSAHPNFSPGDTGEAAETGESPLDADVFDLITKHKQNTADDSSIQTDSPGFGRRSQRKPKSLPRIFVEWIFGALSGIALAYIALAWIMGSRFDLPPPPKVLKPVLRFVLPDRIWAENQQPRK
jgi:hypothetical protein